MSVSRYDQRSPYYNTEQTEKYVAYLDFWNPTAVGASSDDIQLRLEAKYARRPDLLAYDLYGTPQVWWIFAMRNPDQIKDPIYDMRANMVIYVPSKESIGKYI